VSLCPSSPKPRRRPPATWPWVPVDRGTMTRWADMIPVEALSRWLVMFDALTSERHDYRRHHLDDRAWQRWSGTRDAKHWRNTARRLAACGMMTIEGDRITAIPEVDAAWWYRDKVTNTKRQNAQGGGAAGSPSGGGGTASPLPKSASMSPPNKSEKIQGAGPAPAERPPPDREREDRISPYPQQIGTLLGITSGAAPGAGKEGLGDGSARQAGADGDLSERIRAGLDKARPRTPETNDRLRTFTHNGARP